MKKILFYALILVCSFGSIAEAQNTTVPTTKPSPENETRTCGSDAYMQQMLQNPVFQQKFLEQQAEIQTKITQILPTCTNPLIIPIAIHYGAGVTTANQQCLIDAAQAQINQLNLDFASCNANVSDLCDWINAGCDNFGGTAGADAMPVDGACIQFCLGDQNLPAGEDNIGGYAITVGDYIWSGGADAPNWSGYLNIFVDDNAQGNLGIAPLSGAANPNGNGAVILAEVFGAAGFAGCTSGTGIGTDTQFGNGATTTHELGHYFGVDHTFSDNLADTPTQSQPNYDCPTVDLNACTSTAGTDFSGNFMDYVDDNCMFTFTEDQVMLMQATAAAQNSWAIGSVSCYNDWQSGTNTYASCQGACAASNYDFTITDPCTCNNDGNNVTADVIGTFNELVTVGSTTAGESWTVQVVTGANGISVGDALVDNGTTFDLMFTHNDGTGYAMTVEGPGAPGAVGNVTQTVSNICAYPQIDFAPAVSICTDAASFSLSATETTAAVDGSFTYSPAETIDPASYAVGATETFVATYTGVDDGLTGVSADGVTPAYPACNESVSVGAVFVDCAPTCNSNNGTWND